MLNYSDLNDEDLSRIINDKKPTLIIMSQSFSQIVNFNFEEVRLYPNIKNYLIRRATKVEELQKEFKKWIDFLDEVNNVDGLIWIKNDIDYCIIDISFSKNKFESFNNTSKRPDYFY